MGSWLSSGGQGNHGGQVGMKKTHTQSHTRDSALREESQRERTQGQPAVLLCSLNTRTKGHPISIGTSLRGPLGCKLPPRNDTHVGPLVQKPKWLESKQPIARSSKTPLMFPRD